ncbi:hypothetical protein FoTM2_006579 [Fusarium oxysporum f. sp. vasinfectum]|nr:hypothetical protein FoTM2_006579 [Fusarium oxysporum f. sp. vasinfectum]
MPTHGMDEYSSAGWAADLGFGLEAVSNILPEARSPKDMPTGEDHSPVGVSLVVLELVVKWENSDVLPTDATFWGKIPEFNIVSLISEASRGQNDSLAFSLIFFGPVQSTGGRKMMHILFRGRESGVVV